MAYEQRLRELCLLSLGEAKAAVSTTYGVGGKKSYRANEAELFTDVHSNGTWDNAKSCRKEKSVWK